MPTATSTTAPKEQPVEKADPTATPTPAPTATFTPAPTPTPKPEDLTITESGFGQDERYLGFAFIVTNPNSNLAIEDAQYQIAAYDADGTVVETDSGYISLILPGQALGIGGTRILDEGVTVDKVEVQLSQGDAETADPLPSFTSDQVTYLDFVPAKGKAAEVNTICTQAPATVELHAYLSALSDLKDE